MKLRCCDSENKWRSVARMVTEQYNRPSPLSCLSLASLSFYRTNGNIGSNLNVPSCPVRVGTSLREDSLVLYVGVLAHRYGAQLS